jgi:hypothetical protein
MDKMGLDASVESTDADGATPILTITMENMSEPLARTIMHSGVEKGAKDMDFAIVRFANHGDDPLQHTLSNIWEYHADGSAQVGFRQCHLLKDYGTKCTYNLSAGLGL